MPKKPSNKAGTPLRLKTNVLAFIGVLLLLVISSIYLYLPADKGESPGESKFYTPHLLTTYEKSYREAVGQLSAGLSSEDDYIVSLSASSLPYLAIPDLRDEMIRLKERADPENYIRVLPELFALGEPQALEDMKGYLLSTDFGTTVVALEQLERFPPLTVTEELLRNLEIPHDQMAYYVGKVLRKWGKGTKELLEQFAKICEVSYSPDARFYSAITLIALGSAEEETKAWKTIRELAENADYETAERISLFLGENVSDEGYEILLSLLKREESRLPAMKALVRYDKEGKADVVNNYRLTGNDYQEYLVLVNLASAGEPEALEEEFNRAIEFPAGYWSNLIQALREWRNVRALPLYRRIVERDPSRIVRLEISRNLRVFPLNPVAIRILRDLIAMEKDERELATHMKTLGLIGTRREIPLALRVLRTSSEATTRITAGWAILNIQAGLPINTPSELSL